MGEWTIGPATLADVPRVVELLNLTSLEPTTPEAFQRRDAQRDPALPLLRLLARGAGGAPVGYGVVGRSPWQAAEALFLHVAVDPALAGRGAGSALYRALEQQARAWGASRLEASVRDTEPGARAWLERRGFALSHHEYESELDLAAFDPAPFRRCVAEARDRGYRFISMADAPGEAARRQLYELDMATAADGPQGPEGFVATPYAVYARHVFEVPDYDPGAIWVAVHGDCWAGVSGLHLAPGQDRAWTIFTGVLPEFRGQGLAQALKVLSIEYAVQKGCRRIGTGNHSLNHAMLAINRKLGFRPLPGEWRMVKRLL